MPLLHNLFLFSFLIFHSLFLSDFLSNICLAFILLKFLFIGYYWIVECPNDKEYACLFWIQMFSANSASFLTLLLTTPPPPLLLFSVHFALFLTCWLAVVSESWTVASFNCSLKKSQAYHHIFLISKVSHFLTESHLQWAQDLALLHIDIHQSYVWFPQPHLWTEL